MATAGRKYPLGAFILSLLLFTQHLRGQSVNILRGLRDQHYHANNLVLDISQGNEVDCANGIDDDGNGLIDAEDNHCYFSPESASHCKPTSIIWINTYDGLYWINLITQEERLVVPLDLEFLDIAWSNNNILYGVDRSGTIYSIDVMTGSTTEIAIIRGHSINGMTTDSTGSFYLTAFNAGANGEVIKFNPVSEEIDIIVDLSEYDLVPSGDCCFSNGFLYATCEGYIAKIDTATKTLEKIRLNEIYSSYGIVGAGDGYLYVTDNITTLYRMDPFTGVLTLQQHFVDPDMLVYGMAAYTESCVPCDSPFLSLGPDTVICRDSKIILTPQIDSTVTTYLWSSGSSSRVDTVAIPGTYWLKASNGCSYNLDTIIIAPAQKPIVLLGNDTTLCSSTSIVLQNLGSASTTDHFLWSDKSVKSTLKVTAPGMYWLQISNVCGTDIDSINIIAKVDSCECFVYIPNAFSPNNDGVNDAFTFISNCEIEGYLQIFNRWGQVVFKTQSLSVGWDGFFKGELQSEGQYIYFLRFRYKVYPKEYIRKGTITIVR